MSAPAGSRREAGLRLFVDGLLEVGDLLGDDRAMLDETLGLRPAATAPMSAPCSTGSGAALSGVTRGASLVLAPKHEAPIRHIEFVSLAEDRALVVLVFADGHVENRVFTPPPGQTPSSMREAANFLNAIAEGRTLVRARHRRRARDRARAGRSSTRSPPSWCESGVATWINRGETTERLIVRGRGNLLGAGRGRSGADPDPVRRPGAQARHRPVPRTDRGGRGGAHLHRLGEQAFFAVGFLSGRFLRI